MEVGEGNGGDSGDLSSLFPSLFHLPPSPSISILIAISPSALCQRVSRIILASCFLAMEGSIPDWILLHGDTAGIFDLYLQYELCEVVGLRHP